MKGEAGEGVKGLWVEDEVEAEERATQGACDVKPCEVHSGSLIVCDGTQVMTMRERRDRA